MNYAHRRPDGHPVIVRPPGYMHRLHFRLQTLGRLPMWTIYPPLTHSYGNTWAARLYVSLPEPKPTRWWMAHDTLRDLRGLMPPGAVCVPRSPADAPQVVETWL